MGAYSMVDIGARLWIGMGADSGAETGARLWVRLEANVGLASGVGVGAGRGSAQLMIVAARSTMMTAIARRIEKNIISAFFKTKTDLY
jgi:hypothetical protein